MKAPTFKFNSNRDILYFDTEQSKNDIRRFGNMVLTLTGRTYLANFKSYSLRGLSPSDKIMLIRKIVRQQGVQLIVVIDNLRDLCYDINNQKEALELILTIQELVDEGHHFMLVLHVTRGTEDAARGAIGTEAINRAENVYRIVKDGNKSIVKPVLTRGKTFEEFAFEVDNNGLPFILEEWLKVPITKGKGRPKLEPKNIADDEHGAILKKVFHVGNQLRVMSRTDFVKELIETFKTKGIVFGESKAREFISYYLQREMMGKRSTTIGTKKVEEYGLKIKQ